MTFIQKVIDHWECHYCRPEQILWPVNFNEFFTDLVPTQQRSVPLFAEFGVQDWTVEVS